MYMASYSIKSDCTILLIVKRGEDQSVVAV